jgi:hypothetical protein
MKGVADMEQTTVPCVIMRAGTSKGLYFHRDDLPPEGAERDRVLKRLMGSPDILQIDGLGGSRRAGHREITRTSPREVSRPRRTDSGRHRAAAVIAATASSHEDADLSRLLASCGS